MELDIGKSCSYKGCGLIDFLPFQCDKCKQYFCIDHRTLEAHDCPKAEGEKTSVIVCPICKDGIRVVDHEDINMTWTRHESTQCRGSPKKKATCPGYGCKRKLGPSNSIECAKCKQKTCLECRYDDKHDCIKEPPKPKPKPQPTAQLKQQQPRPAPTQTTAYQDPYQQNSRPPKKPGFFARLFKCGYKKILSD